VPARLRCSRAADSRTRRHKAIAFPREVIQITHNSAGDVPEIESFNMADLDVSGLDMRLELTTILPNVIVCDGNCPENNTCGCHGHESCSCHTDGCACHSLTLCDIDL
jgi:hypothetical protein